MIKKISLTVFTAIACISLTNAQTTALQFSGADCNGNMHDLFADLDAGKAVALHFYMPNCNSCPPPAQAIQTMANQINATHPGMVKGYAFPFQNSTTCSYSANWVSVSGLSSLYVPMDSGAYQVAYYGGFGMPTVVLLGGSDHRVMFVTQSFSMSDTTIMRDSILAMLNTTSINQFEKNVTSVNLFPNPAHEKVQLQLNNSKSQKLTIEVVDLLGKQVMNVYNDYTASGILKKEIDVVQLNNGLYFIKVTADGIANNFKLTVAH